MSPRGASLLAVLLLGMAPPAAGQLPSADAGDLALAGTLSARARGFAAGALNPANLALAGNPSSSITLLPLRLEQGLHPVELGDLAGHEGRTVPAPIREEWLTRIEDVGNETGAAGVEVTGAAASVGALAVQVSTVGFGRATLNPDAAELLLFGNVGRTGSPRDFDLEGSSVDAFVATTVGISAGHGVEARWLRPRERLAVGITLSYTAGHYLLMGRDAGSSVSDAPVGVRVRFPVVESRGSRATAGSGVGMNVAVAWERDRWSAGVVARNLVQTFRWNDEDLRFRPGEALFGAGEARSEFEARPVGEAPPSLQRAVFSRGFAFPGVLTAAAAYRWTPDLDLTAVLERAGETTVRTGPRTRIGLGAELRVLPRLPLRGGAALISGGVEVGAGVGVRMGPIAVEAAGALRLRDRRDATLVQLTASYRRP